MREPARTMDEDRQSWGFWAGVAVIALIVFLALVLILPWTEENRTTSTVEKTTPAPGSTAAGQK
jgi:cell division protein FtsX